MPSAFAADDGWRDHDLLWLKRHVARLTQTMTYRKSPQKAAARREWDRFVRSNQRSSHLLDYQIRSSVRSIISTTFFLTAASIITLTQAASGVEALNSAQYDALVTVTESFFAAGYEWVTPVALRAADQDSLAKRFAG